MPGTLYCTNCGHVDLMDIRYPLGEDMDVNLKPIPLICTICAGKSWHNQIAYEKYVKELHDVVNPPPETLSATGS